MRKFTLCKFLCGCERVLHASSSFQLSAAVAEADIGAGETVVVLAVAAAAAAAAAATALVLVLARAPDLEGLDRHLCDAQTGNPDNAQTETTYENKDQMFDENLAKLTHRQISLVLESDLKDFFFHRVKKMSGITRGSELNLRVRKTDCSFVKQAISSRKLTGSAQE